MSPSSSHSNYEAGRRGSPGNSSRGGVTGESSHHGGPSGSGHRGGPGVGVRLNARQPHGRSSLSQINDRERVKLDKFTSLLSAPNVNLGLREFCCLLHALYTLATNSANDNFIYIDCMDCGSF